MAYDHRRGSYAGALEVWRSPKGWDSAPGRKPMAPAFGLSEDEAAEVERDGYPTDGLPEPLRPDPEKL